MAVSGVAAAASRRPHSFVFRDATDSVSTEILIGPNATPIGARKLGWPAQPIGKRPHARQCVEAAVAHAVERVDALVLTAIHLERRGRLARL